MDLGDFEGAARIFRELAEAHPEEPERWLELARAELLAERPARARQAFERVVALRPADPRPLVEVGFTHELERDYDLALVAYARAREVAPDDPYPHRVAGTRLLRWGHPAEAVAPLARAVALDPAHAETWNALALARYHAELLAEAEATFREGSARHPDHLGLRLGLAALLVNAGRFDEALAVYDAVLERFPRFAAAHVGRGLLLHELGREDEAERAFERAVAAEPGDPAFARRLEEYRALRARPRRPDPG